MRPSDKVHCVIPHFSRTTPLRRTPAHIAHSQHSTSLFQPLRAQNTAQIPRRLISDTGTTRRPRPGLPAHKTSLSPATPSSEPGTSSLPHYSRFSTTSLTMSSDDAYMSFLDKVNADLNAGRVPQQGADTVRTETVGADVQVPRALQSVNAYYISDTDEPFEPVTLKWEGASRGDWPSAGTSNFSYHLVARLRAAPCCFDS